MVVIKKKCEWCGKEFVPKRYNQRFHCRKCKMKKWREKHVEYDKTPKRKTYKKVYNKKYNQEHKEERKAYDKKYNQEHKEQRKKHCQKPEIKEEKKAYNKKYNQEHKEEKKAYDKTYKQEHPEERKIHNHKRRARIKGNGGSYTIEEMMLLRKKAKGICPGYNRKPHFVGDKNLTIDHIIAIENGGTNDIENIQLMCKSCNCSKGTNEK